MWSATNMHLHSETFKKVQKYECVVVWQPLSPTAYWLSNCCCFTGSPLCQYVIQQKYSGKIYMHTYILQSVYLFIIIFLIDSHRLTHWNLFKMRCKALPFTIIRPLSDAGCRHICILRIISFPKAVSAALSHPSYRQPAVLLNNLYFFCLPGVLCPSQ